MTVLIKATDNPDEVWYENTEAVSYSYRVTPSGSLQIIKKEVNEIGTRWSIEVEVSAHAWSTAKGDRNNGNGNFDGEKVVGPNAASGS
jgi:hypothetical protein